MPQFKETFQKINTAIDSLGDALESLQAQVEEHYTDPTTGQDGGLKRQILDALKQAQVEIQNTPGAKLSSVQGTGEPVLLVIKQ